jgi:putative toxin-antitoxin system antitoxin component (TIGR02293 family)
MPAKSTGIKVDNSANKKRSAFLKSLAGSMDDLTGHAAEEVNLYANYLGLKVSAARPLNIVEMVKTGFSLATGTTLARHLGLEPRVLFIHYLGMSRSTLSRREKQTRPRLSPVESDKLVRYAYLLSQAARLMEGDREAAREWLASPSDALGGQTPLKCATTEVGARRVEDLITSLEYGMFN